MRIRSSGSVSASRPSAAPVPSPQGSSSTTWSANYPTPFLSPAAHSCCPSTSRTRMPTSDSKSTFAKTTANPNGSRGTLYWTIPASATAVLPSCYKTCEPSYLRKKQKASCSSASSSSVCRHPCPSRHGRRVGEHRGHGRHGRPPA
jgi:hypothetical protein